MTLQHICSQYHKLFLKNTFCIHQIWSVKLPSAQAEGTESKNIQKKEKKLGKNRWKKQIRNQKLIVRIIFRRDQLLKLLSLCTE